MTLLEATVYGIHLLFAAAWTGTVLFVAWAILPLAGAGELDAAPLASIAGRLQWTSRASALALLVTGGHLAATGYSVDRLTGSTAGHLVIGMVLLWLALGGLVEVGAARLADGADRRKVREPARTAKPFLYGASVVAVLLLLDAAALVAGV